jgi:hypothetical protein
VTDFQYYEPVQPVATSISPSAGSAGGGERVTITGTGLGSVTAVKFGTSLSTRVSNPDTYVGASTTEVFAAAPPGVVGTKVPVVVVTLAGTSKPAPVEFSYVKGNPGPPVDATVKAAPGMGIVSWSPPLNDGGSPIIGYSISAHTPSYPYKTTTTYSPYVNVPASARSVDLAVPPFLEWTFDVKARTAIGYQTAVTRGIEVPVGDDGYVIGASDGTARAYGDLGNLPAGAGGTKQPSPIVAFAVSPALRGYWTVAADGVVSAYGSSIRTYGSLAPDRHRTPIVTLLPDSTGGGYWIITAGGGVFPFGDARSYGVINQALTSPIVSAARSLDGKGYWMVAANGTVYPFGDAQKAGSLGGSHSPVVSILGDPTADGYWLVTSSGGVHNYGSAKALPPVSSPASPIVSASVTPDGGGAWLLESNGTVKAVGDALFEGDLAGRLEAQAVSISA